MIKIGPAGGSSSGKAWDDGGRVRIRKIFVSHGNLINSLQFQFVENGTLVLSEKYGGSGDIIPAKFSVVKLNYPLEFLTGINGYHFRGRIVSLTFSSDNGRYGPFGAQSSIFCSTFDYTLGEDDAFGGFHGTADVYLNSIGVYMKPMTTLSNVNNHEVHVKDEKF